MLKSGIGKVMWVGRATVFLIGLSVIFAVVFGVTATAFAANGKPFILGKTNAARAVTTLVKQGPGPALNLVVSPGQPPLKVNSQGKVANFNADLLDGNDASSFLAADGTAADANRLGGKSADEFMHRFAGRVGERSATDSTSAKMVAASCPDGQRIVDGFANIERPVVFPASSSPEPFPVALQGVGAHGTNLWRARAAEMTPYDGDWSLSVIVQCVAAEETATPDDGGTFLPEDNMNLE